MAQKIDISTSTFVRFILILLGIWFLYLIRDVLILLFITLTIVAALYPTVEKWSKKITRPGAVVVVFVIIFAIVAGSLSLILPPLVSQIQDVATNIPRYVNDVSNLSSNSYLVDFSGVINRTLSDISSQLGSIGTVIFDQTVGVISGIVAVVTMFVIAFYLLVEEEAWKKIYRGIVPDEYYENITDMTMKIANKLGAWLRGQLVIMLVMGAITSIALAIVGTPYALTLGVVAALGEVVPIIGQWISAAIGVVVALTVSPLHALLAMIVYVVVQQFETHVLIPKVMSKALGLNPVAVIIAILIGYKLYGFLGIMVAIPIAATLGVVLEDWSVIRQAFVNSAK